MIDSMVRHLLDNTASNTPSYQDYLQFEYHPIYTEKTFQKQLVDNLRLPDLGSDEITLTTLDPRHPEALATGSYPAGPHMGRYDIPRPAFDAILMEDTGDTEQVTFQVTMVKCKFPSMEEMDPKQQILVKADEILHFNRKAFTAYEAIKQGSATMGDVWLPTVKDVTLLFSTILWHYNTLKGIAPGSSKAIKNPCELFDGAGKTAMSLIHPPKNKDGRTAQNLYIWMKPHAKFPRGLLNNRLGLVMPGTNTPVSHSHITLFHGATHHSNQSIYNPDIFNPGAPKRGPPPARGRQQGPAAKKVQPEPLLTHLPVHNLLPICAYLTSSTRREGSRCPNSRGHLTHTARAKAPRPSDNCKKTQCLAR
jgi:hypothetical protein